LALSGIPRTFHLTLTRNAGKDAVGEMARWLTDLEVSSVLGRWGIR
jgi:hypothetical protein